MAAADVVGAMLTRWHYLALIAPLILLGLQWRHPRAWMAIVLFSAILFAAAEAMIDVRIRAIRYASPVPISSLSREHPLRRRFGRLHGVSSLLLLAQVLLGGAAVAGTER
ncbi:MAG TPA: hypothetical protein VII12_15500 [Thermoanaerobaculia bacterium]